MPSQLVRASQDRGLLLQMDDDRLGETLRSFTFVGEGFGCYSTFDVRTDAVKHGREWRECFWQTMGYEDFKDCAEWGAGYRFHFLGVEVDVCWFWDGDGVLSYRLDDYDRWIVNSDCKKDYGWVAKDRHA